MDMSPVWSRNLRRAAIALAAASLIGCTKGGPKVGTGQAAPTLARAASGPPVAQDGTPVDLEKLRARGPVMLVFLRGFG